LQGRKAIVTGGASGIGLAVCVKLAAEGAAVAVVDVNGDAAEAVAADVGGVARTCDVRRAPDVDTCIKELATALGGLDILVNNAGAGQLAPLDGYRDEDWDRLLAVNLTGTFNATRAARRPTRPRRPA
jgi:3-oxoacyl-[acyl-carrier protein] reductase